MKYLTSLYSGRVNRSQYFFGYVFLTIAYYVLIALLVSLVDEDSSLYSLSVIGLLICYIFFTYSLVARRFHDLGNRTLYILTMFIPIVNIVYAFNLLLSPGQLIENKFGTPPKGGFTFGTLFKPQQDVTNTGETTMFCNKCGKGLLNDSKFCISCGNKLQINS